MNDHDLLQKIATDMEWVKAQLENHLHSHFKYSLAAWTVAIGAVISLIIMLIRG